MNDLTKRLFSDQDLSTLLSGELKKVNDEIDSIPRDKFLNSDNDAIIENIYSQMYVIPIEIKEEDKKMEEEETKVDVRNDFGRDIQDKSVPFFISGSKFTVSIPYFGDGGLWYFKPSKFSFSPPRAYVFEKGRKERVDYGFVNIIIKEASDTLDGVEIKQRIEDELSKIREYLQYVRNDVEAHNKRLRSQIKQYVEYRHEKLKKHSAVVDSLNIPLKKKNGAPDMIALPIKIKLVKPLTSIPNKPREPGILDEDYEKILKFIRHVGRTFETTPKTFNKFKEEELRDIILAFLNGYFEGKATGETFRGNGKTDIRIEDKNRAAFIAECKNWDGSESIRKAIDQLLGYTTWRDCKNSLVVFNKDIKDFSDIQSKLPIAISKHPGFKEEISVGESGEWRFKVVSKRDDDRIITLHVFLFDLHYNS